jgi:hypothetical protein
VFIGAMLAMMASTAALAQVGAVFDHLKCYPIKDGIKGTYLADFIPDQQPLFSVESKCKIKVPANFFSVDVVKTNVQPPPPQTVNGTTTHDFLCYKFVCRRALPFPSTPITRQRPVRSARHLHQAWSDLHAGGKVPNHHRCVATAAGCTGDCPITGTSASSAPTRSRASSSVAASRMTICAGRIRPRDAVQLAALSGSDPDCVLDPARCHCEDRPTPCGYDRTANQCGGTCPSGEDCLVFSVNVDGTGNCQCLPHAQACVPGGQCPGYCPGDPELSRAGTVLVQVT